MSLHPLKKNQICLVKDAKGQIMPHPECHESAVRYAKWKVGQPRVVTVKLERSYPFLAKYFAMLNTAYDNQDRFDNTEAFRFHTLCAVGWCTRGFDFKENAYLEFATSISFAGCSEVDFREVFTNTVEYFMIEYCFDDDMFMVLMGYL